MNVAYLGWCPTQTAYTAYSIVHIAQTGPQGHFSAGPQRGSSPIEHLWVILKQKMEEHKLSNIHQLRDVVMEEWEEDFSGNLWSSGELRAQEG